MKYMVTLNGKQYEVEVEKGTASAVLVGRTARTGACGSARTRAAAAARGGAGSGTRSGCCGSTGG